jgi:hypothetical protein
MKAFRIVAVRNYELDGATYTDELRFGLTPSGRLGYQLAMSDIAYSDWAESDRSVAMTEDDVREWFADCPEQIITSAMPTFMAASEADSLPLAPMQGEDVFKVTATLAGIEVRALISDVTVVDELIRTLKGCRPMLKAAEGK